jgi:hypothetical protein
VSRIALAMTSAMLFCGCTANRGDDAFVTVAAVELRRLGVPVETRKPTLSQVDGRVLVRYPPPAPDQLAGNWDVLIDPSTMRVVEATVER